MNKWIVTLIMVVFAAGISVAEKPGTSAKQQLPPGADREKREDYHRPKFTEEQRAEMKAQYEAIKKLAEAIRSETDPVRKEALTSQLRAKLTEGAEKIQMQYRKRIEDAERDLAKMKERLKKREADLEQRVEEKLQKIISGEDPGRRDGPEKDRRPKGVPPAE
jgi:hypothetical protein